jgi:hypothetical protein
MDYHTRCARSAWGRMRSARVLLGNSRRIGHTSSHPTSMSSVLGAERRWPKGTEVLPLRSERASGHKARSAGYRHAYADAASVERVITNKSRHGHDGCFEKMTPRCVYALLCSWNQSDKISLRPNQLCCPVRSTHMLLQ